MPVKEEFVSDHFDQPMAGEPIFVLGCIERLKESLDLLAKSVGELEVRIGPCLVTATLKSVDGEMSKPPRPNSELTHKLNDLTSRAISINRAVQSMSERSQIVPS